MELCAVFLGRSGQPSSGSRTLSYNFWNLHYMSSSNVGDKFAPEVVRMLVRISCRSADEGDDLLKIYEDVLTFAFEDFVGWQIVD